jgi:hypothetical protein
MDSVIKMAARILSDSLITGDLNTVELVVIRTRLKVLGGAALFGKHS